MLHNRLLSVGQIHIWVIVLKCKNSCEEGYHPLVDTKEKDAVIQAIGVVGNYDIDFDPTRAASILNGGYANHVGATMNRNVNF